MEVKRRKWRETNDRRNKGGFRMAEKLIIAQTEGLIEALLDNEKQVETINDN